MLRMQDASTASLVWLVTQMAEHPDVLERVRAEQLEARPDLDATITGDTLAKMPYTRQVSSWFVLGVLVCVVVVQRAEGVGVVGCKGRDCYAGDGSSCSGWHVHVCHVCHTSATHVKAVLVLLPAPQQQVVKEVLRFRPPAPMVPQVAMKPFKLNDNYTVSKGGREGGSQGQQNTERERETGQGDMVLGLTEAVAEAGVGSNFSGGGWDGGCSPLSAASMTNNSAELRPEDGSMCVCTLI